MVRIGDMMYGMRIVKTHRGYGDEESPLFNGFEGIIIWNTWDTSEWQVLIGWKKNGIYQTKEMGYIDDNKIQPQQNGETVACFLKDEAFKLCYGKKEKTCEKLVTNEQVRENLLQSSMIKLKVLRYIPKKGLNVLTEWITEYINRQINIAIQSIQTQDEPLSMDIAIDETIATILEIHDDCQKLL